MSWQPTAHPECEQMTVEDFERAIRTARFVAGDGVLYRYGKPGVSRMVIQRVQARVLVDLCRAKDWCADLWPPETVAGDNCAWTHAGMVLDPSWTVEQTTPRCRMAHWTDIVSPGDRLLIVRPALVGTEDCGDRRRMLADSARVALRDVELRTPYPHTELITYWLWSWGIRRTLLGTSFLDIFSREKGNVCSASVIEWWRMAGLLSDLTGCDARAEAWYPGRMGCDPALKPVAHIEIVQDTSAQTTREL